MDASVLSPGTVVDRYTVEEVLGVGGMATVWRVRHNDLGSVHALKLLHNRSASVRERLVQEGRVQAVLKHPNLVAVTDLVTLETGDPGLILEYVPGPSLADLLDASPLTLEQIDTLARGILDGVAEAHRSGLVHRDLKPANILLEPSPGTWVPKVTDFGIAKVLAEDERDPGFRTRSGMGMGTPYYMAPEQILDARNVGPAADVFALGVILYELATHQRPFDGDSEHLICTAVLATKFTPPREVRPDLPVGMETAILAALQRE
ncbi:MAG: serine/threonine-protein kinase, partial [Myxococcota bacterium]